MSTGRHGRAIHWLGLLTGLATVSCIGATGDAGPRVITLGHVGAPGSLYDLATQEFAENSNARLPAGWRVEIYGSSQLGNDEVMLQKLRLGTLDFSLPSTIMSSVVDAFGLFEMPYLVRDREHMRAIEREVVWPVLAPLIEERGYHLIAVWENGFRHVTNNVRPIVRPEDLRGIKLRTPRGLWRVKLFQAMGANPTPMAFSEVFVALQTGVMDGQENPLMGIESARFYEVQDYLSLTGHVYSPTFVVAGASWDRMPEDVRGILEEAARAAQTLIYDRAAEIDATLLAEMKQAGVQVNEVEWEPFLEASRSVYDEFEATVEGGADLLARVRSLTAEGGV
jgi:tripartite ATP-independent transporter DctP family solute receptor